MRDVNERRPDRGVEPGAGCRYIESADRAPLAIIPAMIVMSDRIEPSSVRPEAHSSSTSVLGPIGTASLM